MADQIYNPYLPGWEYIPDGEPHVFEGRVYIYGSHDRFGGKKFCLNDYVTWSADIHDLKHWRYEGVIYRKDQDPRMKDGKRQLWAPDVVHAKDGKYYLYYCPDGDGNAIGVAAADSPKGPFAFYGIVCDRNGAEIGKRAGDTWQFDPGVFLDDDGRIWLYSGNGPRTRREIGRKPKGSVVMELEDDMLTVKGEPKRLLPTLGEADDTPFAGHEFFEASSIRKVNGRYYLIYSSVQLNELCYAVSSRPDEGYSYGGVVISNAGRRENDPESHAEILWGNNHGGIENINGKWYVFYHRHTNETQFSRQGCAEEITIDENGRIRQAIPTSQGLNGAPLIGKGTYPAAIACILHGKKEPGISHPLADRMMQPFFTQDEPDVNPEEIASGKKKAPRQYVTNGRDGFTAGYRYFDFTGIKVRAVSVRMRGTMNGTLSIYLRKGGLSVGQIRLTPSAVWKDYKTERVMIPGGKGTLYFRFHGTGKFDFYTFTLGTGEEN